MARIHLRVSTGGARSAVVGRHGPGWKVRVGAPPEDGRANAELLRLLAKVLDVGERRLSIVTGQRSRDKIVLAAEVDQVDAERRLDAASNR